MVDKRQRQRAIIEAHITTRKHYTQAYEGLMAKIDKCEIDRTRPGISNAERDSLVKQQAALLVQAEQMKPDYDKAKAQVQQYQKVLAKLEKVSADPVPKSVQKMIQQAANAQTLENKITPILDKHFPRHLHQAVLEIASAGYQHKIGQREQRLYQAMPQPRQEAVNQIMREMTKHEMRESRGSVLREVGQMNALYELRTQSAPRNS